MPSFAWLTYRPDQPAALATSRSRSSTVVASRIAATTGIQIAMQSRSNAHVSKLQLSSDLEKLVSVLRDDTLRTYARGVTIATSQAAFNIDRHTGIRIRIEQMYTNEKLSHSFGAVLGTGTTVFSGPYSYAIVFIDQLDKPEFLVNGEILENNQLVHCHDPISVSVNSGRLD
ncbi:hypothetical protein A1F96_10978 [Pyrenophora tritici-repentis]|nr:hypothetical protein Alg215_11609 [Pyrenophora tritici-repentis]PZC89248.1 hypothetical protein A1F95_10430 [Pyrenophora tritici-repentis]PZD22624.1 hypothetical protein A1F96_10978 [Pyrenophora tritici-repentis]